MAEPVITPLEENTLQGIEPNTLTSADSNNITSIELSKTFNVLTDLVQGYLYDTNNTFLDRLTTSYNTVGNIDGNSTNVLELDPGLDVTSNGYTQGNYEIQYTFTTPLVTGNPNFFITEVSLDRTELRVDSTALNTAQIATVYQTIDADLNDTATFEGFYLDFGENQLQFAVNVGLNIGTLLIKLYQPLPPSFDLNSNFNILSKVANSVTYLVNFPIEEIQLDTKKYLRGPNTNLKINSQTNNTTLYKTLTTLTNASTAGLTNQLNSVLAENRAELNTDYTNYDNFVFFSSANTRLTNFNYKVTQIETYNSQLSTLDGTTNIPITELSASKTYYENQIKSITQNFDGYDYYLYYESSSYAWPKQNSTKPYILYSYTSSEATNWLTAQAASASAYDRENLNNLYEIFPSYIKDDEDNSQFKLFSELTAQMFDEIWIYTKALENRQDGDNSLSGGISTDLVADALRSYGLDIYESSFTNSDLFTGLLGTTETGGTLPPTGSELITNYVTASAETIPSNDAQKLIYKRIYHNLPYLLKKKGTVSGLRVLLNCYGIPDTILRISEFGGKDKNVNTWDNWYNQYNYSYNTSGSGYVSTPWEGAGFISEWIAASPISLPLVPNGTYNMIVDWGDGSTDTITAWDDAAKTHNYSTSGTKYVTITGTIKGFAFNNTGYTSSLTDIRSFGPLELNTSASFYGADELGPSARPASLQYKLTATDMPRVSTTSMKDFFRGANNLSGSIDKWNTETVLSMERAFQDATLFNTPLPWDTSNVTTLKHTFKNARDFNQTLSWDTGLVTDMSGTFAEAVSYNKALPWNTGNVTNFGHMFHSASNFNQPVDGLVTDSAGTLEGMFKDARSFNQYINNWDISNVGSLKGMFQNAYSFNEDFMFSNPYSTAAVVDMSYMFSDAISFGQSIPAPGNNLTQWNTFGVENMEYMFKGATEFNMDLSPGPNAAWDTRRVTNMRGMFQEATSFAGTGSSGGVSSWDTRNVSDMTLMFYDAASFNADISSWNISSLQNADGMLAVTFGTSSFSQTNYDLLLQGWANQPIIQSGVNLDVAQHFTLSSPASASRAVLQNTYNWSITDLGGI